MAGVVNNSSVALTALSYVGRIGYGNVGCAIFVTTVLKDCKVVDRIIPDVPTLRTLGTRVAQSEMTDGDILILRSGGYEDGHTGFYVGGNIIHNSSSQNRIMSVPLSTFPITEVRRFAGAGSGSTVEVPVNDEMKPTPLPAVILPDPSEQLVLRIISKHTGSEVYYKPVVEDGVTWTTVRTGTPAKLEFSVLKDEALRVYEGDTIVLSQGDYKVFRGRVTSKSRDKRRLIRTTAQDNFFHLVRSRDTYNFRNKSASDMIKMVAGDFQIPCGRIIPTGVTFQTKLYDNSSLLDLIEEALAETHYRSGGKESHLFYDDPETGLTLKRTEELALDFFVDVNNCEDFDYSSSIEDNTYNKVKVYWEDQTAGIRKETSEESPSNIEKWGQLQYYEKAPDEATAKDLAKAILFVRNAETRQLTFKNVFGDLRVRAGFFIWVFFDLGDFVLRHMVRVEEATHRFSNSKHLMDLKVIGREINE